MDAQHLRYVRSLMAGTDSNFESIAGLYGADAGSRQHTPVEEAVAGLIGKFDETKSLLWAEPFDDCSDGRARRYLEPGLREPGSSAESTRLWVMGISVEVATPRMAEILVSQSWFLSGVPYRLDRAMCDARSAKLDADWLLVDCDPGLTGNNAVRSIVRWPSVTLFGQKLLDSLPIILCEPTIGNQFNDLHKEGVPIVSAQTSHSNFKNF